MKVNEINKIYHNTSMLKSGFVHKSKKPQVHRSIGHWVCTDYQSWYNSSSHD